MVEALITTNAVKSTPFLHFLLHYVVLGKVWLSGLGNGLSGEAMLLYILVTFIVLVALVIALAALVKHEIGREGSEDEGGGMLDPPSSLSLIFKHCYYGFCSY